MFSLGFEKYIPCTPEQCMWPATRIDARGLTPRVRFRLERYFRWTR